MTCPAPQQVGCGWGDGGHVGRQLGRALPLSSALKPTLSPQWSRRLPGMQRPEEVAVPDG